MNLNTQVSAAYEQLGNARANTILGDTAQQAYSDYQRLGVPTQRIESWKYTRLTQILQTPFRVAASLPQIESITSLLPKDHLLTSAVSTGNQVVIADGVFMPGLSQCNDTAIELLPLTEAVEKYPELVSKHLNKSKKYHADGMQALNTAFVQNGLFIRVQKNAVIEAPVFINHFTGKQPGSVFVQPRILVIVEENAQVQLTECYFHNGTEESFTNEITEMAVFENARLEYYKIQAMAPNAHHVGTTHIQQEGKCLTHCVTVTLSGGTIRNNLNLVFEKANNEGHLYGLYLITDNTHTDNHTIVDNKQPGCFSNELYKGVIDGKATGVFNGRIYVQPDAQKTNAYQSNRNILLGSNSSVNAKPQLEIFADDVKCSHGCTVGRLDETAMFYMRTRGIGEEKARALLLQAFADDILEQVRIEPLKNALHNLIAQRLETEM
jgi:Fe-S cluster assembly protein SufD